MRPLACIWFDWNALKLSSTHYKTSQHTVVSVLLTLSFYVCFIINLMISVSVGNGWDPLKLHCGCDPSGIDQPSLRTNPDPMTLKVWLMFRPRCLIIVFASSIDTCFVYITNTMVLGQPTCTARWAGLSKWVHICMRSLTGWRQVHQLGREKAHTAKFGGIWIKLYIICKQAKHGSVHSD